MRVVLTSRDFEILLFLWRWKVATTATLSARFFAGRSLATSYTRLWFLKKGGFIQFQSDSGGSVFAWSLSKLGFESVEAKLPELREIGFKCEHMDHDLLVTAAHLGEWLLEEPIGAEIVTEQELRRYYPESLPEWIPQSQRHRPDGYWRIPFKDGFLTVALEVELNRKRASFYTGAARFYEEHDEVYRVLWIVNGYPFARALAEKFNAYLGPKAVIHNIVALKDFEKLGWSTPILFGAETGRTIRFLLHPGSQTAPKHVWTQALLDTRKCPHRSKIYEISTGGPSCN